MLQLNRSIYRMQARVTGLWWFCLWTYLPGPWYVITTVNTIIIKAQTVLIILLPLLQLHTRLQSVVQGIFIASSSGNANKLIN